ncbi:NlpC/P60 family protein [Rhodoluna sp.]|jgi:cell wall-associated NlpC family hydrolase|uniref:C40 family peptidase n=1 Tax=Rhodoluna sp. TaxID=1969481 RepID=UPI0025E041D1|nr:NlpC/P60 family protein [Rhodoluna sp.]
MKKQYSRALIAATAVGGLLFSGLAVAPSWAVPSYPTAAEVEAAKQNVSDKKAMIERIEQIISDLAAEADELGRLAQIKGETFNQAQDEVDIMTTKVNTLQSQADAANAKAEAAQEQLGQIAAQMYREGTGGTSLNLLLNSGEADDLLYQLGAQEKVAQQNDVIYRRAIEDQRYAQSVTDELKVAKQQLADKAKIAQDAFDEAVAAANEVQAKVDENKSLNATLYAQLASLRNTAASLEQQRAEGLAAEARQNAGTDKPVAPELYEVGPANSGKVETMLSFAKAQLGERYVLGGIGPDVWDCSGITKASYATAGIYIGTHSATNQFNTMASERKLVPLSQAVKGDLMWYSQSSSFNGDKYHVVIYLGGDMMLEAPNPARTVRIVPLRYGELFPYAGRPSA